MGAAGRARDTSVRSTGRMELGSVESWVTLALDLLVNITHRSLPHLRDLVLERWATSEVAAGNITELSHGRCEPLRCTEPEQSLRSQKECP